MSNELIGPKPKLDTWDWSEWPNKFRFFTPKSKTDRVRLEIQTWRLDIKSSRLSGSVGQFRPESVCSLMFPFRSCKRTKKTANSTPYYHQFVSFRGSPTNFVEEEAAVAEMRKFKTESRDPFGELIKLQISIFNFVSLSRNLFGKNNLPDPVYTQNSFHSIIKRRSLFARDV